MSEDSKAVMNYWSDRYLNVFKKLYEPNGIDFVQCKRLCAQNNKYFLLNCIDYFYDRIAKDFEFYKAMKMAIEKIDDYEKDAAELIWFSKYIKNDLYQYVADYYEFRNTDLDFARKSLEKGMEILHANS